MMNVEQLACAHQFPEEQTPEGVRILFPCLGCGVAAGDAMKEASSELIARNILIQDYEEREAACCPEDVCFEEYIALLTKQRDEFKQLVRVGIEEGWSHEDYEMAKALIPDAVPAS